ncbi:unnamed protein product [Amoebophrya sp. A120]|nr:unnamed protein product [Amoebophrya sp. A120]|eukprot:GSA120T00011696001.1
MVRLAVTAARSRRSGDDDSDEEVVASSKNAASNFARSRSATRTLTDRGPCGKCMRRVGRYVRRITTRRPRYGLDLEPNALGLFPLENSFRQRCLKIVETQLFDGFILMLILLNSFCLAAYHHRAVYNKPMSDPKCQTTPPAFGCGRDKHWVNNVSDTMDPVFLAIFVVEMLMKMVAYGFFWGKKTYLSDSWNWLDFIVVVTGVAWWFLENLTVNSTITMLRVFRVLRPLRALTTMPEMKVLVNTVLQSIPKLGSVLSMTIFQLFIFGVLGLNLWQGIYERRCRTRPDVQWVTTSKPGCAILPGEHGRWEWPLALDDDGAVVGRPCGGRYMCQDLIQHAYFGDDICGSNSIFDLEKDFRPSFPTQVTSAVDNQVHVFGDDNKAAAKFGEWCENSKLINAGGLYSKKNDPNYGYGITNFNNILNAVIVIFQCITMEGWTDIMYMSQDAHSNDFAFIYFCFLVVIGSFFLLNVALAVVWDAFQELSKKFEQGLMDEEEPAPIEGEEENSSSSDIAAKQAGENDGASKELPDVGSSAIVEMVPASEVTGAQQEPGALVDVSQEAPAANDAENNAEGAHAADATSSAGAENEDDDEDEESDSPRPGQFQRAKSSALLVYEDEYKVKAAFDFASTGFFQNFVMACIILNIIIMMMDAHPPIKPPLSNVLDSMNTVFTIIFLIEMVIVLAAIGPIAYVKEFWHALDGIIVVFSVAELFSDGGGGALKSLRLLRIIKLAKKNENFRKLLQAVVQTVLSMGHFTLLLCLMIFVFALMGSIMFANKLKFDPNTDEPVPEDQACPGGTSDWDHSCVRRSNFDSFLWSVVTVFQGLTGENWNALMYDGMRGAGFAYFMFHFAMVVLGMCIIFNLFLAILMANFQDAAEAVRAEEEQKREEQDAKDGVSPEDRINWEQFLRDLNQENEFVEEVEGGVVDEETIRRIDFHNSKRSDGGLIESYMKRADLKKLKANMKKQRQEQAQKYASKTTPSGAGGETTTGAGLELANLGGEDPAKGADDADNKAEQDAEAPAPGDVEGGAETSAVVDSSGSAPSEENKKKFGMLRRGSVVLEAKETRMVQKDDHWLVPICVAICEHKRFDQFILVMIVLSSMGMAFDDPLIYPQHPGAVALTVMNIIFTVIFTTEMAIKHVAMGWRTYWRSGWNVLDGVVVTVSLIDMAFYFVSLTMDEDSDTDVSFFKTLRILRAFRPLRVISRNPNLKLVVNTIFASLPQLRTLAMLMMLFFLIIGLIAINYLKGAFNECSGLDVYTLRRQMEINLTTPTTAMCEYDCTAAENCSQGKRLIKQTGASCAAGQQAYQRPAPDVPICLAYCPLEETGAGVCASYPALKRVTRFDDNGVRVSDLPNRCNFPAATSTAAAPVRQPEFAAGVPPAWQAALEYNLMSCSSCKARYCSEKEISQQCIDFCEDDLLGQCSDSCKDNTGSAACVACRTECKSACACEDNCQAMTQDAALCVEQGASTGEQAYKWMPRISQNFDNIGDAVVTLLEISTTEGWVDVMLSAVDARGIDRQPLRDYAEVWTLFFVLFMLVGCFLILNLCVGVIVDSFAEMKKAQQHPAMSLLITPAQQKWINTQKMLHTRKIFLSLKHLDTYSLRRRQMFFLVNDDRFEGFIMTCIVLNALVMAMSVFPDDPAGKGFDWDTYDSTLFALNYVFSAVFVIEAIMKLFAHRLYYFSDYWNVFDFMLVLSTIVGVVLEFALDIQLGPLLSIMRMFRVARLLRLLQFAKGLNKIFTAFLLSIPKLLNVACICFLLLFLFAVMGIQLFGKVQFAATHDERGNFRSFYRSIMTLVRAMTGEAWNEIMHDLGRGAFAFGKFDGAPCVADFGLPNKAAYDMVNERCLIEHPIGCGNKAMSHLYWVSYTMVITFVVFNLVVAVILEGYEDSTQKTEEEIVNQAIDLWKKYDPNFRLKISLHKVPDFVTECRTLVEGKEPGEDPNKLTEREKAFLHLRGDVHGELTFLSVVQHCIRVVMFYGVEDEEERSYLMRDISMVEQSVLEPGEPNFHKHLKRAMTRGQFISEENGEPQSPEGAVVSILQTNKDKSDNPFLAKMRSSNGAAGNNGATTTTISAEAGAAASSSAEHQSPPATDEQEEEPSKPVEGEHSSMQPLEIEDVRTSPDSSSKARPQRPGFLFYSGDDNDSDEEEEVEEVQLFPVEECEEAAVQGQYNGSNATATTPARLQEGSHNASSPSGENYAVSRDLVSLAAGFFSSPGKRTEHARLAKASVATANRIDPELLARKPGENIPSPVKGASSGSSEPNVRTIASRKEVIHHQLEMQKRLATKGRVLNPTLRDASNRQASARNSTTSESTTARNSASARNRPGSAAQRNQLITPAIHDDVYVQRMMETGGVIDETDAVSVVSGASSERVLYAPRGERPRAQQDQSVRTASFRSRAIETEAVDQKALQQQQQRLERHLLPGSVPSPTEPDASSFTTTRRTTADSAAASTDVDQASEATVTTVSSKRPQSSSRARGRRSVAEVIVSSQQQQQEVGAVKASAGVSATPLPALVDQKTVLSAAKTKTASAPVVVPSLVTRLDFRTKLRLDFSSIFEERERKELLRQQRAKDRMSLVDLSRKSKDRSPAKFSTSNGSSPVKKTNTTSAMHPGAVFVNDEWSTPSGSPLSSGRSSNLAAMPSKKSSSLFGTFFTSMLTRVPLLPFTRTSRATGEPRRRTASGIAAAAPQIKFLSPPSARQDDAEVIVSHASASVPLATVDHRKQAKLRALDAMF